MAGVRDLRDGLIIDGMASWLYQYRDWGPFLYVCVYPKGSKYKHNTNNGESNGQEHAIKGYNIGIQVYTNMTCIGPQSL